VDGDFAIRAGVVDDVTEHVCGRHPLIAVFVVVDLLPAGRFLDDRLIPLLLEPLSASRIWLYISTIIDVAQLRDPRRRPRREVDVSAWTSSRSSGNRQSHRIELGFCLGADDG
jgi:hypothetical protein